MRPVQYIPPWRLTRWGWRLPVLRWGLDEFHQFTRYVVTPLGMLVVWAKGSHFMKRPHVAASAYGVPDGYVDPACQICAEVLDEIERGWS